MYAMHVHVYVHMYQIKASRDGNAWYVRPYISRCEPNSPSKYLHSTVRSLSDTAAANPPIEHNRPMDFREKILRDGVLKHRQTSLALPRVSIARYRL